MKRRDKLRAMFAGMTGRGARPLMMLGLAGLALVLGSIFLSPVQSLWSKNLTIRGDVQTRSIPDRCKDMHFDSYSWGTDRDDKIYGTSGNDMIWGLQGHDSIYGNGGDDCFDGGGDDDRCDDGDGWYDANKEHDSYDTEWGEHESTRNSCDQWGSHFDIVSSWHHSTPTIDLAWPAAQGAVYYNVYRGTEAGGPYTGIASTPAPAYTDVGVMEDTTYYYVVTAVDGDGFESVPSRETSQLVPSPGPSETPTPAPGEATPLEPAATPTQAPIPADTTPAEPAVTPTPPPEEAPTPTGTDVPSLTPGPTPTPTPEATAPEVTPAPTPEPPSETPAPAEATPAETPAAL